jgi:hypothetical protein
MKCIVCSIVIHKIDFHHTTIYEKGKPIYFCGDCARNISLVTLRAYLPDIIKKLKKGKTMVTSWED